MTFKYDEYIGDRWSCTNKGFHEHKKVLYLYLWGRTYSVAWIWAIDPFGRKCTTPFEHRTHPNEYRYRIGYLQFYISNKRNY